MSSVLTSCNPLESQGHILRMVTLQKEMGEQYNKVCFDKQPHDTMIVGEEKI